MGKVESRYGAMEIIENDSIVADSLQLYGEWAQQELDILSQFIPLGSWIIDAGSFIGTHAMAFSTFVGSQGTVYAFEPCKTYYETLSRNIKHNKCENVILFHEGLGQKDRTICVPEIDFSKRGNYGALSLLNIGDSETILGETIRISTIDDHNFKKVDFIKIDVEGMEYEVLEGAYRTIQKCMPVIFLEVNSLERGVPAFEFSRKNHYKAYACLTSAYNENNFQNEKKNIFGEAREFGLILIPEQQVLLYSGVVTKYNLEEITNIDELALVLSHKPQYPVEIHKQSELSMHFNVFGFHYEDISKTLDKTQQAFSRLEQKYVDVKNESEIFQNQLDHANSYVRRLLEKIVDLESDMSRKDELLVDAQATIAEKERVIEAKSKMIIEKEQALAQVNTELVDLRQGLNNKDSQISAYCEELYSVYTSKSWRYMLPMRKIGVLVRRILMLPHQPWLRAKIKRSYFLMPRWIRNSRIIDHLKKYFKKSEVPR